jgi:outer membrane lipoprotein SlyB
VGKNKRTAEFAGGGAAIGAIIGAIAGGGKGAAIGAGAGAGAGALGEIVTKGKIKVPAETVLTFKLDSALRVVEAQ